MATKLDLADAQFTGFSQGKWNNDILQLVTSMGLTKSEWSKWKRTYTTEILTDAEIQQIDEYFERGTK